MPVYKDDKRGTWFVNLSYTNKYKVRKFHTKRGFKKRKDARNYEDKYLIAVSQDSIVDGLSFLELTDHYKDWYASRRKPSSIKTINNYIDNHLNPYFKKSNVHELNTQDILKFHEYMLKKNLSKGYIQDIHTNLTAVLKHGIKFFDLKRNVASIAGNIENETITKWNYWTLNEFNIFYDYLQQHETLYWQVYFKLLFYSGLRHGEQRALTWQDVDLHEMYLNINKNNYNGKVGTTKTKTSNRKVYLPSHVVDDLKQYKEWYKENNVYKDNYVVFGTFFQSVGESTAVNKYKNTMQQLDLKKIKIHEFRHSHASDCINRLNMDKATLAKRLGHSSSSTIEKVYGHLYPSTEKSAIQDL